MENLNAEAVKKALECCSLLYEDRDCTVCPKSSSKVCTVEVMREALALINSQEQRIKELTEENERLRVDNEILKMPRATIFEIADAFDRGRKKGEADTVRKMLSLLHEKKQWARNDNCDIDVVDIDDIDQIAKEMLEGEK